VPKVVRIHLFKLCLRLALLMLTMAKVAVTQSAPASDYTHTIARIDRVALISHHPACNPLSMAFDPLTFDGRGFRAPRIAWHLGYPLLNTGIDASLKAIHTPAVLRWPIVHLGLPLTPHLLQARKDLRNGGSYQLNLYDWIYDFSDKQPIELTKAALVRKVALDVPLSCMARP
jgi:hypothetical protein